MAVAHPIGRFKIQHIRTANTESYTTCDQSKENLECKFTDPLQHCLGLFSLLDVKFPLPVHVYLLRQQTQSPSLTFVQSSLLSFHVAPASFVISRFGIPKAALREATMHPHLQFRIHAAFIPVYHNFLSLTLLLEYHLHCKWILVKNPGSCRCELYHLGLTSHIAVIVS